MSERQVQNCYGFIHYGKKGCRFLSEAPSLTYCAKCKFYKTKEQYYNDQESAVRQLNNKGLVTVTTDDNIVTVIDIYKGE